MSRLNVQKIIHFGIIHITDVQNRILREANHVGIYKEERKKKPYSIQAVKYVYS